MPGMNGLFMINDPGYEGAVQVRSRFLTYNGGSSALNVRYIDILSNGDTVPSTLISTTASSASTAFSLGNAFSVEQQRAVVFYLFGSGNNNCVKWSDDLGVTWTNGTFSARQGRGGMYINKWNKWIGLGLTGSGAPFTGLMFNSDDGKVFTQRQAFTSTNIYFSNMSYSPSLDIAVASNAGTATKNCAYWTTDSLTWYAGTFSGTSFNPQEGYVIWQAAHNSFLLSRNGSNNTNCFALSTDGKNWNPITATGLAPIGSSLIPLALAHNPISGRTVAGLFSGAASGNVIYYSDNGGLNWTLAPVASNAYFLQEATYDANIDMFIISTRFNGSANGFFLSSNGVNWTFYNQINAGMARANYSLP